MKSIIVNVLLFFIVLFYGCTFESFSPAPVSKNKYIDFLDKGSKKISMGYHFMIERNSDGNYIRKQFYPETRQLTHYYTYSNRKLTIKKGLAKEWWDNGDLRFEGSFENNQRSGEWKEYYTNPTNSKQKTISQGNYVKGKKEGVWSKYNENKILIAEVFYKLGKRDGIYKYYNKQGELIEKGLYENDKQIKKEVIGGEIKMGKTGFKVVDEMPRFAGCENVIGKEAKKKCSETKMLKFIYERIKYPEFARLNGIEGECVAQFTINRDGEITELVVIRCICKEIKAEVKRIVNSMPEWSPGLHNGKKIKVNYTLPVSFSLE